MIDFKSIYKIGEKVSFSDRTFSAPLSNSFFITKKEKNYLVLNIDIGNVFEFKESVFRERKNDLNSIMDFNSKELSSYYSFFEKHIAKTLKSYDLESVKSFLEKIIIPSVSYYLKENSTSEVYSSDFNAFFNHYFEKELISFGFNKKNDLYLFILSFYYFLEKNDIFGEKSISLNEMCFVYDIFKEIGKFDTKTRAEFPENHQLFLCQIRAYIDGETSWPPIHNFLVSSNSKEGALEKAHESFEFETSSNKAFEGKISNLRKFGRSYIFSNRCDSDIDDESEKKNHALKQVDYVIIAEPVSEHMHKWEYCKLRECKECGSEYRGFDSYNLGFNSFQKDFCSKDCLEKYEADRNNPDELFKIGHISSLGTSYIYLIKNKVTEQVYVGKTTQVFTLRWYQHFFQNNRSSTKFKSAISNSNYEDWEFSILETIKHGSNDYIFSREKYWIEFYNSIENGYNSLIPLIANCIDEELD